MKPTYQERLDEMLLVKAEKKRPGNTLPDSFDFEGKLLNTSKALDAICMILERRAAGGAS